MAGITLVGPDCFTQYEGSLNTGGSTTLPVPSPGTAHMIYSIGLSAAGTITATSVTVTTNGGTAIAAFGQAAANGAYFNFTKPICCYPANATKVVGTMTGATAGTMTITVNYGTGPSSATF